MLRAKILTLVMSLITLSAMAQNDETSIGKGNWFIGGTLSGSMPHLEDVEFTLNPKASYFLGEKFAIGLNTSYQFNGIENYQIFSAGPTLRYYFKNAKLAPFIDWEYNLGSSRIQMDLSSEYETRTSNIYGAGFGLDYFVARNIALEGTLKYLWHDETRDGNITFNVGLQFFFNRKK